MAVTTSHAQAVWNWKTGQKVRDLNETVYGIAYAPDGKRLYGVVSGRLFAWSTSDYGKIRSVEDADNPAIRVLLEEALAERKQALGK